LNNQALTFDYCQSHTTPPHPVLQELERATHLNTLAPQMLSGSYQGALLRFISLMTRPRRILEVGAFTGYASICLASGLTEDGRLHAIESDDELAPLFNTYINKAGLSDKVRLHNGDAAQIIPTLDEIFDLVFLDAGKLDYAHHYELALAKTRAGGWLMADNVLWHGKVAANDSNDPTAQSLRAFNDLIRQDSRVENILLPVRDGLLMIRKL
jgi:predicted O-methyltransferase YrrM